MSNRSVQFPTWEQIVEKCFNEFDSVTIEPATISKYESSPRQRTETTIFSLEDPIGFKSLRVLLKEVESVTIVVPDATRRIEEESMFAVIYTVTKFAPKADARILIATGLHRPPTPEEMENVPHLAICHYSELEVVFHDAKDARLVPDTNVINPATDEEIPVLLNPLVLEVDLVISLSQVALHQYAGLSGGYKSISIGCAGTSTIAALHSLPILRMKGTQIGQLKNNPFQALLTEIGQKAAPVFSLQMAEDQRGTSYISGMPDAALTLMSRRQNFYVQTDPHDAAVIMVDATKGVNFYQASRAYTYLTLQEHPPLVPNAPVLLIAQCPEKFGQGAGEKAFKIALQEGLSSLVEELFAEEISPKYQSGGQQRAFVIALAAQKHPLHLLCGCSFEANSIPKEIRVHNDLSSALSALSEQILLTDSSEKTRLLVTRDLFRLLPRNF